MATYIQSKSSAFRKIDDVKPPCSQRSECRLKRYSSVTDTRVWMNNAYENKAFIFHFMGQEPDINKRKIMGQIIPIDMIWKVLMTNKNNYIYDLEEKIQSFVDLIHKLSLSKTQITRIRQLCTTTFRSINDHLLKYQLTERWHENFEKSVQANPRMMSTISETKIVTTNVGVKTKPVAVRDISTYTKMKQYGDKSNGTVPCSVSDVCLQVVLAPCQMADKCVSVKVRSSMQLEKKKSINDKTTEISMARLKSSGHDTLKRTSDKQVVTKSRSDIICSKDTSVGAMSTKPRKSCVSFSNKEEFLPVCIEQEPPEGAQIHTAKAFGSDDSIDPLEIIDNIIDCTNSDCSGETIEVISECEQTSFSERKNVVRSSVIQLYRSTKKSSMESTFHHPTSDIRVEPEEPKPSEDYETDHSVEDIGLSNPNFREVNLTGPDLNKGNKLCNTCPVGNDADISDDDQFEDCRPPTNEQKERRDQDSNVVSCTRKKGNRARFDGNEKKDQETNIVSCIRNKEAPSSFHCSESLKIAENKLARNKILAECALRQLELVRQTLHNNGVTVTEIDITKITELLQSNIVRQNFGDISGCLFESCSYQVDPTIILFEQLQLIEQICNAITMPTGQQPLSPNLEFTHSNIVCIKSCIKTTDSKNQIEFYKTKLVKLEQMIIERKKLQENVFKLENELKIYDSIKFELVSDPEIAEFLDAADVRKEIGELKRRAEQCEQFENELACEKVCNNDLKRSISNMSANRFNEYESLRFKAQEADILRIELDRLRLQYSDVQKLKADNVNLYNKCAELQCALQPQSVQRTIVEDNLEASKAQTAEIEQLKKEKHALLCTVVLKECELVDQEDQIDRLVMHIDRLTTTNEEQQEKSKQIMSQLRSDLNVKENYIAKLDSNIEWVEEKLKASITSISKDSNEWHGKLCQMEQSCRHYKAKNDTMEDTINSLRKQLETQMELNKTYSIELQDKNKQLEEFSQMDSCGLTEKMKSVNRMETILKKSHNAVKKVVEELAKQYRCDLKGIQEVVPELLNN